MIFDAMTNFEAVTAAHRARVRAVNERSITDERRPFARRVGRNGVRLPLRRY